MKIETIVQRDYPYTDDFSVLTKITAEGQSWTFSRLMIHDNGSYIEPCY